MDENFVVWFRPNLLRGNSLVLIGSQKHGKTGAYLPAVCSLVEVILNAIAHIYMCRQWNENNSNLNQTNFVANTGPKQ